MTNSSRPAPRLRGRSLRGAAVAAFLALAAGAALLDGLPPLIQPESQLAWAQGGEWSSEARLAPNAEAVFAPSLAGSAEGGFVAVWEEGALLRASSRPAEGGDWQAPEAVAAGHDPALALDDAGDAHLLFVNEIEGQQDIFYSRRDESGWGLPRNVSSTLQLSAAPSLALAGGRRFAAWSDSGRLYFGRSDDGDRWSIGPVIVNQRLAQGSAPVLRAAALDRVYMAWQAPGEEIRVALWSDGAWSLPEPLSEPGHRASRPVMIGLDDGDLALAWRSVAPDDRASLALALGRPDFWTLTETVAEDGVADAAPALAPGAPGLHLVWKRDDGSLMGRTRDAMGAYGDPMNLASSASSKPALARADDQLLLAWASDAAPPETLRYRVRTLVEAAPTPSATASAEPPPDPTETPTEDPDPVDTATATVSATSPAETPGPGTPTATLEPDPSSTAGPSPTIDPGAPSPTPSATETGPRTPTPPGPGPSTGTPGTERFTIYLPFSNQRRSAAVALDGSSDLAELGVRPKSSQASFQSVWTDAQPILRRPARMWSPTMAVAPGGRAHLVWEEEGRVMHASRPDPGAGWSEAVRVAAGDSPSMALDEAGNPHVLLVNRFESRRQVYHLRWDGAAWSLPIKVSHGQGQSAAPTLVAGAGSRRLMAAWSEFREGGSAVVYRAFWDGRAWHSAPVPQARGQGVSLDRRGDAMVLSWHARPAGSAHFDVYAAFENRDAEATGWSLPENVSADDRADQSAASMRVRGDQVELAWEHVDPVVSAIGHARRVDEAWLGGAPAFGIGGRAPRMAAGGVSPAVVWQDEAGLRSATAAGANAWWVAKVPGSEAGRDAWAGFGEGGSSALELIWVQDGGGGSWLYAARREACEACRLLLPSLKMDG